MSQLRVNTVTDVSGTGSTYAPGHVVQVLSVTKTDTFTASAGTNDISGLSLTITPKFTNSRILVSYNLGSVSMSGAGVTSALLLRNSTYIGLGTTGTGPNASSTVYIGTSTDKWFTLANQILDSPATTSPTTYKLQIYSQSTSVRVNGWVNTDQWGASSTLTLMEVAQ
jgi:hypothetical protein